MSDVKKISPVGNIYGWEESEFGEFVLSEDYDALEAEAQALREQVKALQSDASSWQSGYDEGRRMGSKHRQSEVEQLTRDVEALRARAVVVPGRIADHEPKEEWYRTGWNACLEELARLNGKAVSEGLLRRTLRDWESNDTLALWGDMEELQELLGQKEGV